MFWLRNKKNNFQIGTVIWRPGLDKPQSTDKPMHMGSLARAFAVPIQNGREQKLDM